MLFKILSGILGIDDTELPKKQIEFIRDDVLRCPKIDLNNREIPLFFDALLNKYQIRDIFIFKEKHLLYASRQEILPLANKVLDMFIAFRQKNKILYFNVGSWMIFFEYDELICAIRSSSKLSEFELHAIGRDISEKAKEPLMQEYKKMLSFVKV